MMQFDEMVRYAFFRLIKNNFNSKKIIFNKFLLQIGR